MNKIKKRLKKVSLILRGRVDLAFKRKGIREKRSSGTDDGSRSEQSQYGQDDWVADFYKDDMNGRTFVEFGAHDGKTNSNTYRLEQEFGWSGLLVEPIPDIYAILVGNRSCRCVHACISDKAGTVYFLEVTGEASQLSGIFDNFPQRHIRRIEQALQKQGGEKIMHEIRSLTLSQALDENGITKIDYLSIDTEGSEYDILRDFPFGKYQIGVIAVENNYHGDYLIELMDRNGFELADIIGCDEIYVHSSLGRQGPVA